MGGWGSMGGARGGPSMGMLMYGSGGSMVSQYFSILSILGDLTPQNTPLSCMSIVSILVDVDHQILPLPIFNCVDSVNCVNSGGSDSPKSSHQPWQITSFCEKKGSPIQI